MDFLKAKEEIANGQAILGIELGSTRIKAVVIGSDYSPIAQGGYGWENRYEGGYWTYSLEDIWTGLTGCYQDLKKNIQETYGVTVKRFASIGFSAMMHGYMAFDKDANLLCPFRTWRNCTTGPASKELMNLFQYTIPERWSIAHLYQAVLNGEDHVPSIDYITTLAGYIHWMMTGNKFLGIGDASGMFPIDIEKKDFNQRMLDQLDELLAPKAFPWKIRDIMPAVKVAGDDCGLLTEEGAKKLDPAGDLEAGIPCCAPEGDAGTGMVATNSCGVRTGNVSAGTSIFAMLVLEKDLTKMYPEIDMVTTPAGDLVAMVHANNCTSDINAWAGLFKEFAESIGVSVDMNTLFTTLYKKALEGDADCGGVLTYGYLAGEFLTGLTEGRPLMVRTPDSKLTLANLMRSNIFTTLGAVKIGMELLEDEHIQLDTLLGHGGFFKTKGVGQRYLAAAMNSDVSVMETAGEGGAWGIALLAAYTIKKDGESLERFLTDKVFAGMAKETVSPDPADVESFNLFMKSYKAGLAIERAAVEAI